MAFSDLVKFEEDFASSETFFAFFVGGEFRTELSARGRLRLWIGFGLGLVVGDDDDDWGDERNWRGLEEYVYLTCGRESMLDGKRKCWQCKRRVEKWEFRVKTRDREPSHMTRLVSRT